MGLDMMDLTHLDWDSAEFGAWCSEISQTLEVENLNFVITIQAENLHSLAKFRGNFSGLAAARSLRVTNTLDVNLTIIGLDDSDSDSREKRCKFLEKKYEPKIIEYMLPDTLRKAPTEEEHYLKSRPVEQTAAPPEESESTHWMVI